MKQGQVEGGQNGSGLSGIRPSWLRTNWEDPIFVYYCTYRGTIVLIQRLD